MYRPIIVPPELRGTPPPVLEEYVRSRLSQYAGLFHERLAAHYPNIIGRGMIERVAAEAASMMPPPDHAASSLEERNLQLVFRHDCLALGCLDPQCALCQHNPNRRCSVNFDRKYLVNDFLKARCAAPIRVELIDPLTGLPVLEGLPDLQLQICVLDGNVYDAKFLEGGKYQEGGTEPAEELEACALLYNKKKNTPLLISGTGSANDDKGFVVLGLVEGRAVLQELHVSDSSEAILSGRKPPFRLLVRVIQPPNMRLKIRHAVSEGFVVATRRTRTAGKVDIPSVDDHISKLEHMGKETVKKLQDIRVAAQQAGVEIDIPENSVQRVGEFKMLSLRAEQDGHLRQRLQHVLKLSKEKWDEAKDHAMRAVVADNRMRAWYANQQLMDMGLLFVTQMGKIDLDRPVGLLQTKREGGESLVEAVLQAHQTPTQREMVRHMQPKAITAWWIPGHVGWAIFPMDSEAFLQTGSLTSSDDSPPSYINQPSTSSMSDRHPDPNSSLQPGAFLTPGPPPIRSHSNHHLFHPQHQRLPASPTGPPPHLQLPDSPTILALGTTHFQSSGGGLYNNRGGSGSPRDSFANGFNQASGHDVSMHHSNLSGNGPQQHSPMHGTNQGPTSASGSPHLLVNAAFPPAHNLTSQGTQGRSSHMQQPLQGQVMAHQSSPGMTTWQPHGSRSDMSPRGVIPGSNMFAHDTTAFGGAPLQVSRNQALSSEQQPHISYSNNSPLQGATPFSMHLGGPSQPQQQKSYGPRDNTSSPRASMAADPGERFRAQSLQGDRGGGRVPSGGDRDPNGQPFRPLYVNPGVMNQGSLGGGGGQFSSPSSNSSRLHSRSMSMPQQPDVSQQQQGFSEGSLQQQQQQHQQRQLYQQQLQQQRQHQQLQEQHQQQSEQHSRYSHQQHQQQHLSQQQQQQNQRAYGGMMGGAFGGELPTLMEQLSTEPPTTRQRTEPRSNVGAAAQKTPQGTGLDHLNAHPDFMLLQQRQQQQQHQTEHVSPAHSQHLSQPQQQHATAESAPTHRTSFEQQHQQQQHQQGYEQGAAGVDEEPNPFMNVQTTGSFHDMGSIMSGITAQPTQAQQQQRTSDPRANSTSMQQPQGQRDPSSDPGQLVCTLSSVMGLGLGMSIPSFAMNSQDLEYVMGLPETLLTMTPSMLMPPNGLMIGGASRLLQYHGEEPDTPDLKVNSSLLQNTTSGLQTMQSIEQALPDLDKPYDSNEDDE